MQHKWTVNKSHGKMQTKAMFAQSSKQKAHRECHWANISVIKSSEPLCSAQQVPSPFSQNIPGQQQPQGYVSKPCSGLRHGNVVIMALRGSSNLLQWAKGKCENPIRDQPLGFVHTEWNNQAIDHEPIPYFVGISDPDFGNPSQVRNSWCQLLPKGFWVALRVVPAVQ